MTTSNHSADTLQEGGQNLPLQYEDVTDASNDGYEKSDVKVRSVVFMILGVGVFVLAVQGAVWGIQHFFSRLDLRKVSVSPLIDRDRLPPEPRLQEDATGDYARWLTSQQSQLNQYRWKDRKQATVIIPVSRAMELILERGLGQAQESAKSKTSSPTPAAQSPAP